MGISNSITWVKAVTSLAGFAATAAGKDETLGLATLEAMICVATTSGTGLTAESGKELVVVAPNAVKDKDLRRFSSSFLTVTF